MRGQRAIQTGLLLRHELMLPVSLGLDRDLPLRCALELCLLLKLLRGRIVDQKVLSGLRLLVGVLRSLDATSTSKVLDAGSLFE